LDVGTILAAEVPVGVEFLLERATWPKEIIVSI
jgi:hypothetical protein